MVEIKRTLLSVRLWIVIALCIFINICLVVKGQSDQNFGFQETSVSVEAVRSEYYALLDECIECDIDSALKKVNDTIDFASEYYEIINLIQMKSFMLQSEQGRQQWNMAFAAEYERYNERYSELIRQIEKGENSYDDEQLVRSVAATKLKEQLEYLTGYEDSIDNILGSSEKLGSFSIFRDETGFANINILKTVQDFKAIEDVQVRLGNYDGIEAFFDFSITDYLLVVIMFTIIIGLSEEQKKGLYQMLRSCKYGREHLIRSQSAALLVGTTVSTLLLYGSSLITCVVIYNGTGNLFVSAQSIELFRIFPVAISIAGVILLFVVIRVLSAFAIGTFIWLVFFGKAGRMKGSVIICSAILFAEYLLFAYISDTSALNYLKYFNLFILVGQFLLVIYITRLLIIISITSIVLFLSSLFHRVEVAYLSICLIMLLPAVLWKYMGIEVFQWITPLKAIDVIGQITMTEGKIESALWSCAIVGIMGAGSVILMQRKWCR